MEGGKGTGGRLRFSTQALSCDEIKRGAGQTNRAGQELSPVQLKSLQIHEP